MARAFNLRGAQRGTLGSDTMAHARRAVLDPRLDRVSAAVAALGVPARNFKTGAAPTVAIESQSLADWHTALTVEPAGQTLKLWYEDGTSDGRVLTCKAATLIALDPFELPAREGRKTAPAAQITYGLHQGSGGANPATLAEALVDAAGPLTLGSLTLVPTLHLSSIARGASGSTAMQKVVGVRLIPEIQTRVGRDGAGELPATIVVCYVGLRVEVTTEETSDVLSAITGAPSKEKLTIVAAKPGGSQTLTINGVELVDVQPLPFQERQQSGAAARSVLVFELCENGASFDAIAELVTLV